MGEWRIGNNNDNITVTNKNVTGTIERLPPPHIYRTLVLWIPPDGTYTDKTKNLRKITAVCADPTISGHILRTDSWYHFKSTIKK